MVLKWCFRTLEWVGRNVKILSCFIGRIDVVGVILDDDLKQRGGAAKTVLLYSFSLYGCYRANVIIHVSWFSSFLWQFKLFLLVKNKAYRWLSKDSWFDLCHSVKDLTCTPLSLILYLQVLINRQTNILQQKIKNNMKQLRTIVIVFIAILFMGVFSACTNDETDQALTKSQLLIKESTYFL